jgi:hypothetical protein
MLLYLGTKPSPNVQGEKQVMCIERIESSAAEKLSLYYAAPVKSYVMDCSN